MITPDSSVVIAAAAPWHERHDAARRALLDGRPALIAHVAFETTAVLSRLPEGHRLNPAVVLEWLARRFPDPWLVLPGEAAQSALSTACSSRVRGGGLYDALIAATAVHHRRRLVSADRRAAGTYTALGVDVDYL